MYPSSRVNLKQQGMALVAMMLVVFMAGTAMFFAAINSKTSSTNVEDTVEVREQLVLTKQALLAYAINFDSYYDQGPGRLPCPEIYVSGTPTGQPYSFRSGSTTYTYCGSRWYRHKLAEFDELPSGTRYEFNDYYADVDKQFWYAVSSDFANDTWSNRFSPRSVNSSVEGQFTLDGEADYVAVIIAPGDALEDQTRPSTTYYRLHDDYLESTNAPFWSTAFVTSDENNPDNFDDQVIGITRSELMTGVTAKVAAMIKKQLDEDHPDNGDTYPISEPNFESDMSTGGTVPSWYEEDDWDDVVTYTYSTPNLATVSFQDCSIIYTLSFDDGISRDSNSC